MGHLLTFSKQTKKRSRRRESEWEKRKRSRHNNNLTISWQHRGVKCDKRKFNCKGHFSPSHPSTFATLTASLSVSLSLTCSPSRLSLPATSCAVLGVAYPLYWAQRSTVQSIERLYSTIAWRNNSWLPFLLPSPKRR